MALIIWLVQKRHHIILPVQVHIALMGIMAKMELATIGHVRQKLTHLEHIALATIQAFLAHYMLDINTMLVQFAVFMAIKKSRKCGKIEI